ncbi:hypothetical protein BC831DRAFT_440602 [Entophlyctis helioformis]|nr:hypothetical protein BC831DRAFT_440602 [Entophlyctis helioformis]
MTTASVAPMSATPSVAASASSADSSKRATIASRPRWRKSMLPSSKKSKPTSSPSLTSRLQTCAECFSPSSRTSSSRKTPDTRRPLRISSRNRVRPSTRLKQRRNGSSSKRLSVSANSLCRRSKRSAATMLAERETRMPLFARSGPILSAICRRYAVRLPQNTKPRSRRPRSVWLRSIASGLKLRCRKCGKRRYAGTRTRWPRPRHHRMPESSRSLEQLQGSLKDKEDAVRREAEQRLKSLIDEMKAKEADVAEAERKLGDTYDTMRRQWEKKLSRLEEEMNAKERELVQAKSASPNGKPSSVPPASTVAEVAAASSAAAAAIALAERAEVEARQRESEAREASARAASAKEAAERSATIAAERDRELKSIQLETERAMSDEKERRRKVDEILDDIVRQEHEARTRRDILQDEFAKQEREARSRHQTALDEIARLERDVRSKQAMLKQDTDKMEREHREVERKQQQYRDELRQFDLQMAQKRQSAMDLGPLEKEVETRRQDLVQEKLRLEDSESELRARRQRLEDDKFRLGLTEKEVLLLRRQLEEEKRSLETAQTDLAAERRHLSAIRTSLHSATGILASGDRPGSRGVGAASSGGSRPSSARGGKHRKARQRSTSRSSTGGGDAERADDIRGRSAGIDDGDSHDDPISDSSSRSDDADFARYLSKHSGRSKGSRGDRSKGVASDDSESEAVPGGAVLKQFKSRLRREEQELQKAKMFLTLQRQGIDERASQLDATRRVWDAPGQGMYQPSAAPTFAPQSQMQTQAHGNGADHGAERDYSQQQQHQQQEPRGSLSPTIHHHHQAPPGPSYTYGKPAVSNSHTEDTTTPRLTRLQQRSGSLDEIEGELNRLLDVLKVQTFSSSHTSVRRDPLNIDPILDARAPASSTLAVAMRALDRTVSPSRPHQSRTASRSVADILGGHRYTAKAHSPGRRQPSTAEQAHRSRAWESGHTHNKALLAEHSEWLRQFNSQYS